MKLMKSIARYFRERRQEKRNPYIQYTDNYTLLGNILGSYCSMLKFDDRRR